MFIWASFANHWDLLLRDCDKRRKETEILTTQKSVMKTHIIHQTKHCLRHNVDRQANVSFPRKRTLPLDD